MGFISSLEANVGNKACIYISVVNDREGTLVVAAAV
jgi:hypothetical protein